METLKQKIGGMLVIGFRGKTVDQDIKRFIHDFHVGGIILFGRNIGTPEEVLKLTTGLQEEAKKAGYSYPLLICIDQENGVVRRLGKGTTMFPGSMLLGATQNPENAYHIGKATGEELRALGINWNLAPTVDVNNNPRNPVIGVRSYGETPETVSSFARQAIKGMQEAGVLTTIKHFPGHGDTAVDSHLDLPVIHHTKERLKEIELKPFIECIEYGADTVMSAHVYFPTIETEKNRPATLSRSVITGLLREELGYDGVVTTDCMEMDAISKGIGTPKGGVEAVKAGVDFVMISLQHDLQEQTIEALVNAVEQGEIEESQIDKSLDRIHKLKERYVSWETLSVTKDVPKLVGSEQHQKLAQKVVDQGVTLVHNNGILPLSPEQKVLVVYPQNRYLVMVEDPHIGSMNLGYAVQNYSPNADIIEMSNPADEKEINRVVKQAKQYDVVLIGTITALPGNFQIDLVQKLKDARLPIVVVATRSPYDLAYLPEVEAYLASYEFTTSALQTVAAGIYGEKPLTGQLPVTVPNDISFL